MAEIIIRRLIYGLAVLMLMLPAMAFAHGGGERIAVIIGGYQVSSIFAEPVRAGENLLHIQILDGMGLPVRGAQVEINTMLGENKPAHQGSMEGMEGMEMESGAQGMPGMAGMHDMSTMPTPVSAKEIEGEYVSIITFSAAGHWLLNTHLSINGQMLNADFPVEVAGGSAYFALTVLLAFIGLNALIIWAASLTKPKTISA